jgi:hypothetical protein
VSVVVSEETIAGYAEALRSDRGLLAAAWKLKRWTEATIAALEVGWDGERFTFPLRDDGGALVGIVRYVPEPLRLNGVPKSIADQDSVRGLFPQLVDEAEVWLVEGEPDALTARSAGLPAIAIPGTQGWKADYAERFEAVGVVIVPDCDDDGRKLAQRISADLVGVAASVRVLDLGAGRPKGFDIGDALCEDVETIEELRQAGDLLRDQAARVAPVRAPEPEAPKPAREIYVVETQLVRPQPTRWLWQDRIPLGAATVEAGRQGLGKSTHTIWLAAEGSHGRLAGDLLSEPFVTLIVSYEDNVESTIVPRLLAAGADRRFVKVVKARTAEGYPDLVSLPGDLDWIADLVDEHRAKLLVVDPLVASLPSGEINSHQDQDVRRALGPLSMLAEEKRLAALGLMHFRKGPTSDLLMAIGGSGAFTAAARQVLAFGIPNDADPDGPKRALLSIKENLTERPPALRCEIEGDWVPHEDGSRIRTSKLVMGDECDLTADDITVQPVSRDERTDLDVASDFLEELLGDRKWHALGDILKASQERHISERTLYRASKKLAVSRTRSGFPATAFWAISPVLPMPPERQD